MSVVLTERLLVSGLLGGCGLNAAQADALGIPWPPRHGWKRRVIGSVIEEEALKTFLALKGVKKKNRRHKKQSNDQPQEKALEPSTPPTRDEYVKSAEWKIMHELVLDYYGEKCEHCGRNHSLMVMRRDFRVPLHEATVDQLKVACRRCADNIRRGLDPVEGRGRIDQEYASIIRGG